MSTKTSVNPATKRSEVHSRRRRWPASCSTPTPEMKDRYTGSSGSTHGEMNESRPATNASPRAERLSDVTVTALEEAIVTAVMRAPESPARPPAAACRASLDGLELVLELRLRRGADDRGLHVRAAVDEERRRDPRHAPRVADRAVEVHHDRIGDAVLAHEALRVEGLVVRRDSHDLHVGMCLRERDDLRRFLVARAAPGGEEVDDGGLPLDRGQVEGPALERAARERLGGAAGRGAGRRPAADDGQRRKDEDDRGGAHGRGGATRSTPAA